VTGRQAPHTFTSGGAQVLGLNIKDLPTDSADEAYKSTFGIDFSEDTQDIFIAVVNRHDIVHRNGKTKSGENITVTRNNVVELIDVVSSLVAHVDAQLIPETTDEQPT